MIALDLFCGAGGASKGLLDAGFKQVIGIDCVEQPEYFDQENFKLFNVFDFLKDADISGIGFIWASPPCQAYSIASASIRNKGKKYPDLVAKTRKLLLKTGKPFVIENVPGAPLRKDLMLCGEMFNLRIVRHRLFEIHRFTCSQLKHPKHKKTVGPTSGGKHNRSWYMQVSGHGGQSYSHKLKDLQKAMQINWIQDKKTLAQCVPPVYAEYIGKEFLRGLK